MVTTQSTVKPLETDVELQLNVFHRMVKRATSAHLCQFRRLPSKVEDVLLLAEVLDDNLKTVWPGADDTRDSDTHRYTLFKQTPPPLSSPAKQTVVHAVHGAHAQVDQPFGFGRSLFALKVDELGVGSLQDEVEVLPPLAFTWGGETEAGLIPAASRLPQRQTSPLLKRR